MFVKLKDLLQKSDYDVTDDDVKKHSKPRDIYQSQTHII